MVHAAEREQQHGLLWPRDVDATGAARPLCLVPQLLGLVNVEDGLKHG